MQGPGAYDTAHLGMTATVIRSSVHKGGTSSFINAAKRTEMASKLLYGGEGTADEEGNVAPAVDLHRVGQVKPVSKQGTHACFVYCCLALVSA